MNTSATIDKNETYTTLFDLIDEMQQKATTPLDEALIVPTVTRMLRSGQIRFRGDDSTRSAA